MRFSLQSADFLKFKLIVESHLTIVDNDANQIDQLPANPFFSHTFHQCRFVILDPASYRQDAVTDVGRNSVRLEHVSTFFPDNAPCRLRLRTRIF